MPLPLLSRSPSSPLLSPPSSLPASLPASIHREHNLSFYRHLFLEVVAVVVLLLSFLYDVTLYLGTHFMQTRVQLTSKQCQMLGITRTGEYPPTPKSRITLPLPPIFLHFRIPLLIHLSSPFKLDRKFSRTDSMHLLPSPHPLPSCNHTHFHTLLHVTTPTSMLSLMQPHPLPCPPSCNHTHLHALPHATTPTSIPSLV